MVYSTFFNRLLVILLFLSSYTAFVNPPSQKPNLRTSKRLDECRACQILTDSFNHWLDKTSRGKFEGGDADWEESKLKSYSRSEIRLVEIQEGLCSELKKHKDECYSLSEEAEEPIEQWWANNDPATTDLYTWLCISTLAHCCPVGHFGPECTSCLRSSRGLPCGGRGKCSGNGTRKGTGKCRCSEGYSGDTCEACALDYYHLSAVEILECGKCDASCKAGSGCESSGPRGCRECALGWVMSNVGCVDEDECATSTSCLHSQYCVNTVGSHRCHECDKSCSSCAGEGPIACVQCSEGYSRNWAGACSNISPTYTQLLLGPAIGLLASVCLMFRKARIVYAFVLCIPLLCIYLFISMNASTSTKWLHQNLSIEKILNLFHFR